MGRRSSSRSQSPSRSRSRSPRKSRSSRSPRRHEPYKRRKSPSRSRSRSRSPSPRYRDRRRGRSPSSPRRYKGSSSRSEASFKEQQAEREKNRVIKGKKFRRHEEEEDDSKYEYGVGMKRSESEERELDKEEDKKKEDKLKPNFELSGKLSEEARTTESGVVLKFAEPPDARVPTQRWRLYPFKEDKPLDPIPLRRQSAFLFGREKAVADILLEHPSCSKQHSVLQFRAVEKENEEGERFTSIRPYIMDLKSTNGTLLNGQKLDDSRYYELKEKDVLKFGFSSREYVLLREDIIDEKLQEAPDED